MIKEKANNSDLYYARIYNNFTTHQAADFCGLHRSTYQRQENGQSKTSIAAYKCLMMRAGFLPNPFNGWKIQNGKIWSPDFKQVGYSPDELNALWYHERRIFELEREIRILERQLEQTTEKTPEIAKYRPENDNIVKVDFKKR